MPAVCFVRLRVLLEKTIGQQIVRAARKIEIIVFQEHDVNRTRASDGETNLIIYLFLCILAATSSITIEAQMWRLREFMWVTRKGARTEKKSKLIYDIFSMKKTSRESERSGVLSGGNFCH